MSPEFYECLTEEEYDEILDLFDEAGIVPPESMGDAQAAAQFVWDMGTDPYGTSHHRGHHDSPCHIWTFHLLYVQKDTKKVQLSYMHIAK